MRSQRRGSSAGGGSTKLSCFGETEGGVVGPLDGGGAEVRSSSSSESSLLSEPESEPESELELALPELCGASAGLDGWPTTTGFVGEHADGRG